MKPLRAGIKEDLVILRELLEELTTLQTELDFYLDQTPRLINVSIPALKALKTRFGQGKEIAIDMVGTLEDLEELVDTLLTHRGYRQPSE